MNEGTAILRSITEAAHAWHRGIQPCGLERAPGQPRAWKKGGGSALPSVNQYHTFSTAKGGPFSDCRGGPFSGCRKE